MIRIRTGEVLAIQDRRPGLTEILVRVEGKEERAINYDLLTGPVKPGDMVVLNTTAVYKKLGTGGTHFVMANLTSPVRDVSPRGHIMKARYTPSQVKVLAVEEEDHPGSSSFRAADSLDGIPVVIASLHSMIAPAAAVIHWLTRGRARVVYVMTDGGALPLPLSRLVFQLKEKQLLAATVTCGHAFGGDYEAVTVYSGLLAARSVARADIIIAAMGPGITGTSSTFGFTGLEQGELVNAVHILKGQPVAAPRLSFADSRERHRGLSHHTRTALGRVALVPCTVPLPVLGDEKRALVWRQLRESGILDRHRVVVVEENPTREALRSYGINVTTMGRDMDKDPEFFLAAGAAGAYAAGLFLKNAASMQGSPEEVP
ncbi:Protein of unknown function [Desulfofundulus australicus DSM 11792]|uniref:DUF3866 domain-containing protein n=1 Tax=Desulfofundulus australicus DSM 11792 TaxID=1121425 RepID=A0A1M5AEL3_9FIRM|nr:DUF3866 family protein [Desulfofundulus australicus]SHF28728.1 Protein of unknown function [Desulfofundulus australicus DSM 11792]